MLILYQTSGGSPSEVYSSPDVMSYDRVVDIMAEADKLLIRAQKVPLTTEGLLRLDCDIRTVLSVTASRVAVEVKRYNAVFTEYERIRTIMEERNLEPEDFAPIKFVISLFSFYFRALMSGSPAIRALPAARSRSRSLPAPVLATTPLAVGVVAQSVVAATRFPYLGVPALVKNFVQAFF
jgi:hypothetical protein